MFRVIGNFNEGDCGHDLDYFKDRGITIDCRGPIKISKNTMFGFDVSIFTKSHLFEEQFTETTVDKPVVIGNGVFIGSGAILSNCRIGERSIISSGAVVIGVRIPSDSFVSGNPCKIEKRKAKQ